ncbi:MAG: BMP family ABC transporter substrate-binding protein [Clostridia bacterium]|nr:BMP family ABC transporter substrate-binding protein [Clostridia bacterium]
MLRTLKILGAYLLISALIINLAGCARDNGNGMQQPLPKSINVEEEKEYKVGVVLSENDLGANNAVTAALIKANNTLNIEYRTLKAKELATPEDSVRFLAENDYDLVIGVGPGPSQAIDKLSGEYTDIKFASTEKVEQPNVAYYDFRYHEGGFLSGVLAATLTKTERIAFVGGAENDLTRRYYSGFVQGVNYINTLQKRADVPAEVQGSVYQGVYQPPRGNTTKFTSRDKKKKDLPKPLIKVNQVWVGYFNKAFNQPEKAKAVTLTQIDKGVDVIFQVAGRSGQGVLQAAGERGVKVIGTGYNPKEKTTGLMITNVVQNLEEATLILLKDLKADKFRPGPLPLGLKENAIGLTTMEIVPEGKTWANPPNTGVQSEVVNLLGFLKEQISAGKIIIKG